VSEAPSEFHHQSETFMLFDNLIELPALRRGRLKAAAIAFLRVFAVMEVHRRVESLLE
jgi:hypothetical protein